MLCLRLHNEIINNVVCLMMRERETIFFLYITIFLQPVTERIGGR